MALLTRRALPALAASLVAVGTGCKRKPAPASGPLAGAKVIASPDAAPAASFATLDGGARTLASFAGRPVVLNFWATWCTPCVAELPELDALAAAAPDIAVLVASADHGGATAVEPFLASHAMTHATVLLDQQSEAVHAFGVFGFPTTVLIDAKGVFRARLEGPAAWSSAASAVRSLTA